MTAYKLLFTLTLMTLVYGCDTKQKHSQLNEINGIVFATGGCYGGCPVQAIFIDSTLNVQYHGIEWTDTLGFFVGTVSKGFWDTLNIKFQEVNYKKLDSNYTHSMHDLSTEVYLYLNDGKIKHIYGRSESLPDSVLTVYNWLMASIRNIQFKQSKDSFTFPTTIQRPILPPPILHQKVKSYR